MNQQQPEISVSHIVEAQCFLRSSLAIAGVLAAFISTSACSVRSSTVRRASVTALGGAAGGFAAHELSGGNLAVTAAGAGAGALITQLAQGDDKAAAQSGFDQGYVQGQSDALKRQYFLRHAFEQKPLPVKPVGETVFYTLPAPRSGETDAGTTATATIKVVE